MTEYEYDFTPSKTSEPYLGHVNSVEDRYGLPRNMLANLIQAESGFNPDALGPETKYGKAKGITQIISQFHPDVDPYDPESSIDYAGQKLKEYYDEFGSWDAAIASWNAGPTNMRKHGLKGIQKSKAFAETQNYLKKINAARRVVEPETYEPAQEGETDQWGGIPLAEPDEIDEFGGRVWHDPKAGAIKQDYLGRRLIDNYVRPVITGLGTAAGVIIGGGGGATGGTAVAPGPGTVAGAGAGGVAGGALGYGITNRFVDMIQEWLGYYEPMPVMLHMQKAGEDVTEAATWEMGGMAVGPAAGLAGRGAKAIPGVQRGLDWLSSMLPRTEAGAKKQAGKVITAWIGDRPMIVQSIEEAKAIEEMIPGLKFDLGQLTGDASVVRYMKEGVENVGDLAVARAERGAANMKAINDFIKATKGERDFGDVTKPLQAVRAMIKENESLAKRTLEQQQAKLAGQIDPIERGKHIYGQLESAEKVVRKRAEELFDAVPEQDRNVDELIAGFEKILKPSHRTEGKDKFPKVLRDALKEMKRGVKKEAEEVVEEVPVEVQLPNETPTAHAYRIARSGKYTPSQARAKADILRKESDKLKDADKWQEGMNKAQEASNWREAAEAMEGQPQHKGWDKDPLEDIAEEVGEKTMTLKDIQGLRSEILEDLRTAIDKGQPRSLRKRLSDAVDAIDSLMLKPGEKGSKELKAAQKFYREEVVNKYGKGAVGKVLRGEEEFTAAGVADAFFRPGARGAQAADEFMKVMGNNKVAKAVMRDHINEKIFNLASPKTGEITKSAMGRFFRTYQHAINKLGLGKEYNTLAKARFAADKALAASKEFEKSATSRILKADVNDVIKEAFSKGSKREAAKQIMKDLDTALKPFSKADRKRATRGLQNAMIDEILTEIPLEGELREVLSSKVIADKFRKYDAALKIVFKDNPEKIRAMHNVRKAVKTYEYDTGEKAEFTERYAADVFRRIAFLHGHGTVAAVDISRKMIRHLRGISKEKIHKYVNRAVLDPQVAWELMEAAKGGSKKKIDFKMSQSLIRLGLIAPQRKEDERKKR